MEFVTFLAQSSDCDSHNITWREKKIVGALNLVTILIRMRKRRCMKFGAKTLRNNFGMKAMANEMDMASVRMAKRNARSLSHSTYFQLFRQILNFIILR